MTRARMKGLFFICCGLIARRFQEPAQSAAAGYRGDRHFYGLQDHVS